jgi:hypothetical protein
MILFVLMERRLAAASAAIQEQGLQRHLASA